MFTAFPNIENRKTQICNIVCGSAIQVIYPLFIKNWTPHCCMYGLAEFEWKWRLVWFAALNEWLIIRVIWPKCKNCGRTIVQLQTPPSVLDFTSSFGDHRLVEWRRGSQKYKIYTTPLQRRSLLNVLDFVSFVEEYLFTLGISLDGCWPLHSYAGPLSFLFRDLKKSESSSEGLWYPKSGSVSFKSVVSVCW